MKKIVVKICAIPILLICVISCGLCVFAAESSDYFTFVTSKNEVFENDEIRISINANNIDLEETIAGFRLNVEYDSTKLTLKRVDTSSQMKSGTFRYNVNEDAMTGVYVCDGKSAPKLSGECLTLVFRVNQGAVMGETSVSAKVDQVVNWNAHQLSSVSSLTSIFTLKPGFTREAVLSELVPNHGTLQPNFDPFIQEYTLNVGSEVDQILFDLKALDGGTARVNRKNLGKQGSVTQFIVTVVSADKKNKSQYIINVNRGAKEDTKTTSSGKSSSTKKTTSGKSKSSGTVGNYDNGNDNNNGADGSVQTVFYGDRNLYMIGNQMPTYVIYMILGGGAILIICIISAILIMVNKKRK